MALAVLRFTQLELNGAMKLVLQGTEFPAHGVAASASISLPPAAGQRTLDLPAAYIDGTPTQSGRISVLAKTPWRKNPRTITPLHSHNNQEKNITAIVATHYLWPRT